MSTAVAVLVMVVPLCVMLLVRREYFVQALSLPGHAVRLLVSARLRRNHAIEHATVYVLAERYGQRGLSGVPTPEGFRIRAAVEPLVLLEAAHEGLRRLQRGDTRLSFNAACVTSYLSALFLICLVSVLILLVTGSAVLVMVPLVTVVALVGAALLHRPLQRLLTSMDVHGMVIDGLLPVASFAHELTIRTRPAPRRSYEHPFRGQPAYLLARITHRRRR